MVALSPLEIDLPELVATRKDIAVLVGVEHRNAHASANILGGIHDNLEVGVVVCPWRKPIDVGPRVFLDESLAELAKAVGFDIKAPTVSAEQGISETEVAAVVSNAS